MYLPPRIFEGSRDHLIFVAPVDENGKQADHYFLKPDPRLEPEQVTISGTEEAQMEVAAQRRRQ